MRQKPNAKSPILVKHEHVNFTWDQKINATSGECGALYHHAFIMPTPVKTERP
jgi:hypothetical protein